jgi:hypothetical protein
MFGFEKPLPLNKSAESLPKYNNQANSLLAAGGNLQQFKI